MLTSYYLLLAASTAATVLAQAPGLDTSGCTSKSFTVPSWYIEELQYFGAATNASASFHLLNRANNFTASLGCQVQGNGWNACTTRGKPFANATVQASIQVTGDLARVLVNQTWACNDRGVSLSFTAVGNSSVALSKGSSVYTAVTSPLLVKGTLLSPVAATPIYAEGPTGHDTPGCSLAAKNPRWTISTVTFIDQTGDGAESIPYQNFHLLLTNPTTGYEASCMPGTSYEDRKSLATLVCAGGEFQSSVIGRYQISTNASFDPATFSFTVSQSWFCDDVDAGKPVRVTATGTKTLPLTCTSEAVQGAPKDTRKICIYDDASISLNGKLVSEEPLPPYSIEDPVPRADGCTISSLLHPQWSFSAFQIAGSGATSSISFNLILATGSRGFQYPIEVYQGEKVGDSSWFKCEIGPDGGIDLPLWPYECSFKYEPATKELTLNAAWACKDLDPDHPILFNGVSSSTVNAKLVCETVGGISQCAPDDPFFSWTAAISNVKFGSK
ncbi:hypothetical protein B0T25DRAFT_452307 [Lasiosphaeria hispida]|uniref:AA1-like domain-containing protein n=1 Tax=Lasiosphaeria hispida TaxID=260671 RepID=A0AAJ0HKB6_9PEZI|nr:hypothetical protein B0T25DRAFT_452307 [Lasiosphaeria hispida]